MNVRENRRSNKNGPFRDPETAYIGHRTRNEEKLNSPATWTPTKNEVRNSSVTFLLILPNCLQQDVK